MAEYYDIPCDRCWMEFGEAAMCLLKGMPGHQLEHPTASSNLQDLQDPFNFLPASSYTCDGSYGQHRGHGASLFEDPFWGYFNDVSDGYINPAVLQNDPGELAPSGPAPSELFLGELAPSEQNHGGSSLTSEDVAPETVDDGDDGNNVPQKRGRGRPPGSKNKPKDPNALQKERRPVGRPPGRDYMREANVRKRERRRAAEAVKKANGTSTPGLAAASGLAPASAPGFAPGLAPAPGLGLAPGLAPAPGFAPPPGFAAAPGPVPGPAPGFVPAPAPAFAYVQMSERQEQVEDDSEEYFAGLLAPVAASIRHSPTHPAQDKQQ